MRRPLALLAVGTTFLLACGQVAEGDPSDGAGGQGTGAGPSAGGASSGGGTSPTGGQSSSGGGSSGSGGSGGGDGGSGGSGGAGSGGQDTASGGQGSGGEQGLCPGVVPECDPGEQGCNVRGETYTCDECGLMDLQGEACVRLLASDKELGMVCSVRGEKELKCAAGDEEWAPTIEYPMEMEEFPTAIRLPDDATISAPTLAYCWLDEAGGIDCGEHDSFGIPPNLVGGSVCTDLAVSENPFACALCDGDLECGGTGFGSVSAPDVRQVVISDANALWLTNAGSVYYQFEQEEPALPGTYSFLFVDDAMNPCGIREDGALVCASAPIDGTAYELEGDFVRGSAAGNLRCVIGTDGTITCKDLVEGQYLPAFAPAGSDFVDVAASNQKSCALTKGGAVVCFNAEGLLDAFAAKLN